MIAIVLQIFYSSLIEANSFSYFCLDFPFSLFLCPFNPILPLNLFVIFGWIGSHFCRHKYSEVEVVGNTANVFPGAFPPPIATSKLWLVPGTKATAKTCSYAHSRMVLPGWPSKAHIITGTSFRE